MSGFATLGAQPELATECDIASDGGGYQAASSTLEAEKERIVGPLLRGLDIFSGVELMKPRREGKVYVAPWEGGNLKRGFCDGFKWMTNRNTPKFPPPAEAAARCPTVPQMDMEALRSPSAHNRVQATWMGHASYLVQVNGINVLTDPVWSDRASPVQFAGPKRFVPPPLKLEEFPCRVDVVTISHNHYDHLDTATVTKLRDLFDPIFVVPKGMKSQWFDPLWRKAHPSSLEKVHELSWWECAALSLPQLGAQAAATVYVTAVPVQHWSMRTSFDRNHQLWCGFVYETPLPEGSVVRSFHSGDTAYCSVFRDIGKVFGRFDFAMIAIGAYNPRWFMNIQHVDPEEAVRIHLDLCRPTLSCGMHWGTFILTDEPIDEPPILLQRWATQLGLDAGEFVALHHGQTVTVTTPPIRYAGALC